MEFITVSRKRGREESVEESDDDYTQPDTKRMRLDEFVCWVIAKELLLDEPVESPAAEVDQDLESVIRSFEEEIYSTATASAGSDDVVGLGDELRLGLGFEEEWMMDLFGTLGLVDDAGEGIIVNNEDSGSARCDDVDHNFLLLGDYEKSKDFVSLFWPASLPAL